MGCSNSVYSEDAEETIPILQSRAYKQLTAVAASVLGEKDKWYHGNVIHQEAENRLRAEANGTNSMYMMYDSPSRLEEYVLLVYNGGEMHRWAITQRQEDGKFIIGDNLAGVRAHETVQELLNYYSGFFGKDLKLHNGGPVKLRGFVCASYSR